MSAPWRLAATPLAALAAALSVAGLSGLVILDGWAALAGGVLVATAAAVVLARLATARPFVPTAVGAAAGAWLLIVAYVPRDDGGRTWIPGGATVRGVRAVADEAVRYAEATVAPAPVEPALAAAIAAGVVALFLAVDALAVSAGLAATSGFVLLVPWIPALALDRNVPTLALGGAIAAWLALIALSRRFGGAWRHRGDEGVPAPAPVAAVAATAAVALALALAPLAIGGPGWGAAPRLALPDSFGGVARLDLEIDLRDSLTARSDESVLTYGSTTGRVDVLRLYAMAGFDGTGWDRDVSGEPRPATGILWPGPFPGWAGTDVGSVTVQVGQLSETRVPMPPAPRLLTAGTGWAYDAATDEVIIDEPSGTQGVSYTVRQAATFHDESALRATQSAIDAGGDAEVDERYVEVDPSIDRDRIEAIARAATGPATDRLDQAVLLQDYLRGSQFQYSTEVTATGDDMVSAFLEDRRGFCVHFATTMVVMARTLDIPARMAVGFLGGTDDGTGRFVVRGRDAHAWPELYFPGHGWVRFEPTPPVQTGSRPSYAPPLNVPAPTVPDIRPTALPTAGPAPVLPTALPDSAPADPVGAGRDEGGWTLVVTGGATVLAIAAAGWLAWRRRGVRVNDAEDAWALLAARVGEAAGDASLTPAEVEARLAEAGPLDPVAREALAGLRGAVSDHRYAPGGCEVAADRLRQWAETVGTAVRESRRGDRASDARREGSLGSRGTR